MIDFAGAVDAITGFDEVAVEQLVLADSGPPILLVEIAARRAGTLARHQRGAGWIARGRRAVGFA